MDGAQLGEGRVAATVPLIFSADETADIGRDTASPVSDDYAAAADHLISPEERLRVVMTR